MPRKWKEEGQQLTWRKHVSKKDLQSDVAETCAKREMARWQTHCFCTCPGDPGRFQSWPCLSASYSCQSLTHRTQLCSSGTATDVGKGEGPALSCPAPTMTVAPSHHSLCSKPPNHSERRHHGNQAHDRGSFPDQRTPIKWFSKSMDSPIDKWLRALHQTKYPCGKLKGIPFSWHSGSTN